MLEHQTLTIDTDKNVIKQIFLTILHEFNGGTI